MTQQVIPGILAVKPAQWVPVAAAQAAYAAVCGATPLVCLYGPKGVGKSALLQVAQAHGATVWDDVETLDEAAQIELFHALQRLAQGGRVVVASGLPVAQLASGAGGLKPDVKSRLLLGVQLEVGYPTAAELRILLAHWAAERQLHLLGVVADYVLSRADRSPQNLKALLESLDGLSLQHKRALSVPLVREVLGQEV